MTARLTDPVLLIGGSGVIGSQAARILRRLHPELPITIGGRDLDRAESVAREIGQADAARIDLERGDLGLPADATKSAVAVFLKDETLRPLTYAQERGVPHISLSSWLFEVGPEVAHYIHRPASAPILMASHWLAGAATLPALHFIRELERIDTISLTAVLDEQDMGGPAASADYERITGIAPPPLILEDGRWRWARGSDASRTVRDVDGVEVTADAYSPFDVVSLASATGARSVRFDLVYGLSASRRRGDAFSTAIIIELTGVGSDGEARQERYELVHPAGQAPVTALGVALGIERLLGLAGGPPVTAGLYLPEVLIEPAYMVARLEEFGMKIERVPAVPAEEMA